MAHVWALTGMELTDPTYLYVHTDDDNLVSGLEPVGYRAADFTIKTLMRLWEEYEPSGSPLPPKDIAQFEEFITATYGTQTYMLRQLR